MPNGSTQYDWIYGEFNGSNYPVYHRLDLRINRHFHISRGRISAFLALINIYDRGNVMNLNYYWATHPNGKPYLMKEKEYWFRLLPSVGVSWGWGY